MSKIEDRIEESARQHRALADLSDHALGGASCLTVKRIPSALEVK